MSKEYITRRFYNEEKHEYDPESGWMYTCDNCGLELGEDWDYSTEVHDEYKGLNTGQYECSQCKKGRERAYDRYVTSPFRETGL